MKRKLFVVGVGAAIGYLLGSHAGRERYDAMKARI
ncbi:MAG: protoporphyrinogen oxidase, partial [Salinibacterium sp.]|nr:protoporphyrinogen oxidase [Salinibacterium sp.]